MRNLRCYRCEELIPISNDTPIIDQGRGGFSATIGGRYHSFSNRKINLAEDEASPSFVNQPEEEIITALEDVPGTENITGEDHGY